ncbi:MAG: protein translocase subunit SecF [Patescibacteria group bacterium]
MQFDVIGKRNYFLGFSGALVLASIVLVILFGLRPGIDLTGGTQWQVRLGGNVMEEALKNVLRPVQGMDVFVKKMDDGTFLLRLPHLEEGARKAYLAALQTLGTVDEKNYSNIGPTVGSELQRKSLWAIGGVLVMISLYIAWAFRKVSQPIQSWKYGIVTLVTLFHDVAIPTGLLAFLGWTHGIEIDTNFIVALLVVMGFSVHDTIVVFDRIREHLLRGQKRLPLVTVFNESVNETFTRSVNTSLTLILVLIALLFFGPAPLFYFVLTILVGTIFGTYSSIFVASPLLYLWGREKQGK